MIKLSILIPVYNVASYINRCLDSIFLTNRYTEQFEVILVNDGSTDNSEELILPYINKYSNCKLISQANKGLSMARNIGVEHSIGEYIWFVDSDDWLFEKSVDYILELIHTTDRDLYATILDYTYDNSKLNHRERYIVNDNIVSINQYMFNYPVGASQRFVLKRTIWDRYNLKFYPNIYHEDGDWGPRMLICCTDVYIISKSIYHYYQRETGSIMSNWKLKNSHDLVFVSDRVRKLAHENAQYKTALLFLAFQFLVFAFQYEKIKLVPEISELYSNNKGKIYSLGAKILFKKISKVKKIRIIVYLIHPRFSEFLSKFYHKF